MIISTPHIWASAAKQHNTYVKNCAMVEITRIKKNEKPSLMRNLVLWFAQSQLDKILDPLETSFIKQRRCYDKAFPKGPAQDYASKLFNKVFDYKSFIKKGHIGKQWCAYDLCKLVSAEVCPYCQLVPIETVMPDLTNNVKGYRPELDHHYAQASYPFLALSLGNLIPCCDTCNGPTMKHNFPTAARSILHPQRDPESIDFMLGENGDFENPLLWALQGPNEAYRVELIANSHIDQVENAMAAFQLKQRYNNKTLIKKTLNDLRELRREPDQTTKLFHFVAQTDYRTLPNNGYRNEITGKMIRDLHEQFCAP